MSANKSMFVVVAAVLVAAAAAFAAVPNTINYQGYLRNTDGTPVSVATSVRFSLYSSFPARSNPVWRETKDVSTANGIYSTQLGSVIPITAPFDVPYWLGVKVAGDAEMALQPLSSVPYALNASSSNSSTTLSGQTLSQLDMRYLNLATSSPTQQQIATLRWDQILSKTLTIPVGDSPQGIIFDGSSIWVANSVSDNVMKINPGTGAIIGTYPVGDAPVALAYDGASIWVTNRYPGSVSKLNPATGTIMGIYPVGNAPVALAYDGSSIWVANENDDTVTKLNPTTGAIIGNYPVGSGPVALVYDGSSIWVANFWDDTVTKLNPTTGATIGTYTAGYNPISLVFDGRNIWVGNDAMDIYSVTKINSASGAIIGTYGLGFTFNPASLAFDGRYVWVAGPGAKKIDPDTGAIMGSFDDGVAHQSMVFDGSSIWMTNPYQDSVMKLANAGVQAWDFSVGATQLATQSVEASKLAFNAVTTIAIADNAVINSKIANNSVTASKLANNAVTTTAITDASITNAKISGTISDSKLSTNVDLLNTAQTLTAVKTFNPSSGSVPFAVDSMRGGVVTNLNADRLDGYHFSSFARLGFANTFTVGPQLIQTGADGSKGLIVRSNSSGQSENLQEWQDSSGAALVTVGPSGNIRTYNKDIYLRDGTDTLHGVGWYVSNGFASGSKDGPVVYGCGGGTLGSTCGGNRAALTWDNSGNVMAQGSLTVNSIATGSTSYTLCSSATNSGIIQRCGSARKLKESIADLLIGLDTVNRLRPVSFTWKANGNPDVGFIAEEVAALQPVLAIYNEQGEPDGVKYATMSAVLVKAVQEQQLQIEQLKAEIAELKRMIIK